MPLSTNPSRSRIPLFRSFSASSAAAKDKNGQTDNTKNSSDAPRAPLGFSLPTLSALANLNLHRRGRSTSNARKGSSHDSRWKPGDRNEGGSRAAGRQQQQQLPEDPVIDAADEDQDQDQDQATPRKRSSTTTTATAATATSTAASTASKHRQLHSTSPSPSPSPCAAVPATTADTTADTTDSAAVSPSISPGISSSPSASRTTSEAQATPLPTPPPPPSSTRSLQTPPSSSPSFTPPTPNPDPNPNNNFDLSSSSACADSSTNNNSLHPNTHPIIRPSPASSPKFLPQLPANSIDTTDTISSLSPPPPPPAPPLLVVQRPSTPTVPTLPQSDPDSHESLPAMQRKIWVKRPGASPTRVEVAEDDLVDNIRDVILHKYANSLGRSIDAPDIALKILSREPANKNITSERILGPEEPISKTLDAYYPGGQTVEEALIIDVPSRRTPRASPRAGNHQISYFYPDQYRPDDAAREYFPPMPVHSPHLAQIQHQNTLPHAMSVLTTGQLPPLPSPGSHSARRHGSQRPVYRRQHTSSPTLMHTVQPNGQVIETKSQMNGTVPTAAAQPLPTPPAQATDSSLTPPNRAGSPHAGQKPKKKKNPNVARSANGDPISSSKAAPTIVLDNSVPPINVLLVEDNVINLKLLEAFMKRLKVRWKSAMNGKEAVTMWRTGGFHLVLMDIQLPVMNGLEATKEIRRLEAVNGIGVFSGSPIENGLKMATKNNVPVSEADTLPDRSLFKSPVIIVALTASSLQSDRHEALAAGCNDFLTKPVNFVWMERKVTEWGCMQALIDFDGWRKWKQYAQERAKQDPVKKAAEEKEEKAKAKAALKAFMARPPPSIKKDAGTSNAASAASTAAVERSATPTQNGTVKKGGAGTGSGVEDRKPRSHKSSRSTASITTPTGNLESMVEEDEKAS
ncbi:osomolarity two-component system, response regulator SSK1 [Exophiala aquamarina CBS 119918]|uniref:Osomolarity two-component system, response regulator SSK1 n=1 Tax=Exophiala aquamarina CBS 119918 TaxID=1182545 RepID=A0A072PNM8_9EURO|nr:osomolarity two-component system, response regulator SSK1 [Exophiala aquamarina CBS 119918]KEF61496.1 osomolarity two-component system, response regulator SSK1 [Exophiala aquamarina CBS 119918]